MSELNPDGKDQAPPPQNPVETAVPDPTADPTPVAEVPLVQTLVSVGLQVMSGGAAILFAGAMLTPCVGATRSARLIQGQRRQEIVETNQRLQGEELRQPGSSDGEDAAP